ncbi:Mu transposase domain-containing protein [Janthinobacterium sp. Ant5-2-1]|uniref:Mu transposase domain-containing protein n=1 Tax=Janthinobacterium sp. Ant5-2-1 TaxID=1755239 RepID=UPI0039E04BE0
MSRSIKPLHFERFVKHRKRVSPTWLMTFDQDRYSVPATFANRPISIKAYSDRLVFVADGNIITEHVCDITRDHVPGGNIFNSCHYLAILHRKPRRTAQTGNHRARGPVFGISNKGREVASIQRLKRL